MEGVGDRKNNGIVEGWNNGKDVTSYRLRVKNLKVSEGLKVVGPRQPIDFMSQHSNKEADWGLRMAFLGVKLS